MDTLNRKQEFNIRMINLNQFIAYARRQKQ